MIDINKLEPGELVVVNGEYLYEYAGQLQSWDTPPVVRSLIFDLLYTTALSNIRRATDKDILRFLNISLLSALAMER